MPSLFQPVLCFKLTPLFRNWIFFESFAMRVVRRAVVATCLSPLCSRFRTSQALASYCIRHDCHGAEAHKWPKSDTDYVMRSSWGYVRFYEHAVSRSAIAYKGWGN
jgi:hypothetical protein